MEVSSTRAAQIHANQSLTSSQKAQMAVGETKQPQIEVLPKPAEPPKPVFNTLGQPTGLLLNVTA